MPFQKKIMFHSLKIEKHRHYSGYENVCLYIDDDEKNQICTDKPHGFSDQISNSFIRWSYEIPRLVTKINLVFREIGDLRGWAILADLKIMYSPGEI